MTQLTLRYDIKTHRITQTYWGNGSPEWVNAQRDGETVTTTETTQQMRENTLNTALNSVEAGTDYDPNTETVIAELCYDPDNDDLYAEVEIQPITS